jgi:ribosomal protein S27AE
MTEQRPVPVICLGCGHREVLPLREITAALMCTCGSDDLDVFDEHTAAGPHEYGSTSVPTHQAPSTIDGWNEYQGPMPGPNEQSNGIPTPITCPICHGSGFDPQDSEGGGFGGTCRTCRGSGIYTPMTEATPPMVARHPYPSNQTKVPFMGSPGVTAAVDTTEPPTNEYQLRHTTPEYTSQGPRGPAKPNRSYDSGDAETYYPKAQNRSPAVHHRKPHDYSSETAKPFSMPGSSCPNCGDGPLSLRKDADENAWASCPNCGPLVNIDRHPEYDPYNLRWGTELPKQKFKEGRRLVGNTKKTGRLLSIISSVQQSNPGLSMREAVTLARQTVARY